MNNLKEKEAFFHKSIGSHGGIKTRRTVGTRNILI
jgi:hypothetical protein